MDVVSDFGGQRYQSFRLTSVADWGGCGGAGLHEVAGELVDKPDDVAWVDVSFNNLTKIEDELLHFKHLRVLYLHGNGIAKLCDVRHSLAAVVAVPVTSLARVLQCL